MVILLLVDDVEKRRHRRSLSGSGRTGDQYDSLPVLGELGENTGQVKLFESRQIVGDNPEHRVQSLALLQNVSPVAAVILDITKVQIVVRRKGLPFEITGISSIRGFVSSAERAGCLR